MSTSPKRMPKCGPIGGGSAPAAMRRGYALGIAALREIYRVSKPNEDDDIFLPCEFVPALAGGEPVREGPQRNVVHEYVLRILEQRDAQVLEGFCAVITGFVSTPASGSEANLDVLEDEVRHSSHLDVVSPERIAATRQMWAEIDRELRGGAA